MAILTDNQSDSIQKLIEDPEQVQLKSKVLGRQANVLLVWLSESDWYGLTSNGKIFTGQIGKEERSEILDKRLINIISSSVAADFDELKFLAPQRAEEDPSCQFCGGTGDPDTSIELGKCVCYCGGLGWLPGCDPEARPDDPEKGFIAPADFELTDTQKNAINGLKDDEIQRIDNELIHNTTGRFRKVAMIIGLSIQTLQKDIPDIPDVYYQQRVRHLVSAGELESVGDLNLMRFSEVRIARKKQ